MINTEKSSDQIRVLQLIDSLDAGGAERMSVNLANGLAGKVGFSALVTTRKEGLLKNSISTQVSYFFLERKKTIDLKAVRKLNSFINKHNINLIHAHATSFFMAFLIKLIKPDLKIIWHDHYGESENLRKRPFNIIKLTSFVFSHIISVNLVLKQWAKSVLKFKNVSFLRNFAYMSQSNQEKYTFLEGRDKEIKIVQIANLRPQKAHKIAFEAIKLLKQKNFSISLHCIGSFSKTDPYFVSLISFIEENNLSNYIKLYGSKNDIFFILEQSNIGLLSSRSEGLPVALLEYAQSKLPVVVTDVGQCAEVVGSFGKVVPPNDPKALADAIMFYTQHPVKAHQHALNLHQKVKKEFNPTFILNQVIDIYCRVLF